MGLIISNKLSNGTNRKSHGQNCGSLIKTHIDISDTFDGFCLRDDALKT